MSPAEWHDRLLFIRIWSGPRRSFWDWEAPAPRFDWPTWSVRERPFDFQIDLEERR